VTAQKAEAANLYEEDDMGDYREDYRYSEEARERELKIVWQCTGCGRRREDYPGYNEGGMCECGGEFVEAGESYLCESR